VTKREYIKNEMLSAYFIILFLLMFLTPNINIYLLIFSVTVGFLFILLREKQFDKNSVNPLDEAHLKLIKRYKKMIGSNRNEEDENIYKMLLTLQENIKIFPSDKSSRWLGYIQRYLIEQKLTTVQEERDFSRPLFHTAYRRLGYNIPKSVTI